MVYRIKNQIAELAQKLKQTGFFHVFGSSVINNMISFLRGIILVRIISKSSYGVYTYAQNIYGFFIILSGMGLASAVLQLCSEQSENEKRFSIYSYGCRNSVIINTFLALIIFISSVIIKFPIEGANQLLMALSALPVVEIFRDQQLMFLRTELRNREYSIANTFSAALTLILSIVLSLKFEAYGLIAAGYLTAIILSIYLAIKCKIPFPKKTVCINAEERKTMWGIGVISMLNNGLSGLMYLLDIFVIGVFIPDETVIASYKVATTIPSALYFIPSAILIYAYPLFARHKNDKAWTLDHYHKLTLVSGIVNFTIAIVLILMSGVIVPLIFGTQYEDAIGCFCILCLSFAISGTFRMIGGNLLVTQRKLKVNLFVSIFSSAFNTVMNIILVLHWGSIGAAVATLLTVIITSAVNTVYLSIVYRRLPG